jgi:uncharacterized cupin superfamily protein
MPTVNEADVDWETEEHGDHHVKRKRLAAAAGGEGLGCSRYELPPGRRGWPYHYHAANEEALYVLSGEGTLRTPDGTRPLAAGDYAAFPAGRAGAHAVVNDGDDPLCYLIVSEMTDPDVTVYPDSDGLGVYVGSPPGRREDREFGGYYRRDDDVDFWELQDAGRPDDPVGTGDGPAGGGEAGED